MRICIECKCKYIPSPDHQFFCSKECGDENSVNRTWRRMHEVRTCIQCGVEFWATVRGKRQLCDKICTDKYNKSIGKETGTTNSVEAKKHKMRPLGRPNSVHTSYCVICGKIIGGDRSSNAKTCSQDCANRLRRSKYSETISKKTTRQETPDPAKSLENITKICKQYNISYSDYQTMQYTGTWREFIAERT